VRLGAQPDRRDGGDPAIGDQGAIDRLAEACRTGPAGARVEDVERCPADDDGSADFQERATAKPA